MPGQSQDKSEQLERCKQAHLHGLAARCRPLLDQRLLPPAPRQSLMLQQLQQRAHTQLWCLQAVHIMCCLALEVQANLQRHMHSMLVRDLYAGHTRTAAAYRGNATRPCCRHQSHILYCVQLYVHGCAWALQHTRRLVCDNLHHSGHATLRPTFFNTSSGGPVSPIPTTHSSVVRASDQACFAKAPSLPSPQQLHCTSPFLLALPLCLARSSASRWAASSDVSAVKHRCLRGGC